MVRKEDDKMDVSGQFEEGYDRKVEARFTKQAKATMGQKGDLNADKIDDTHMSLGDGDGEGGSRF